jgi:hypothetical protein
LACQSIKVLDSIVECSALVSACRRSLSLNRGLSLFGGPVFVGSNLLAELHLLFEREVVRNIDDSLDGSFVLTAVSAGPKGSSAIRLAEIKSASARRHRPKNHKKYKKAHVFVPDG